MEKQAKSEISTRMAFEGMLKHTVVIQANYSEWDTHTHTQTRTDTHAHIRMQLTFFIRQKIKCPGPVYLS